MKTYSGDYAQEVIFPLSGIGSGGVGISGIGQLIDWELDGRANKESSNEYSHFAIKAERNGKVLDTRILHGDRTTGLNGSSLASHHHSWGYGQGPNRTTLAGLAHFSDVEFTGEFPFAELTYKADTMPADIRLKAFNPFIPGDEDASSLPAAFFLWEITNTSDEPTDYTLAFSCGNPFRISDGGFSTYEKTANASAITLTSRNYTKDQAGYGELQIATDCEDVSYQEYWYRSGWFDDVTTFWREFSSAGPLKNRHYDDDNRHGQQDIGDMCTLAAKVSLMPGEKKEIRFLMTWYYPNFVKYWDEHEEKPMWHHEYVRRFADAGEVRDYCFKNFDMLYGKSAAFRDALLAMTLPEAAVEAAVDNLSVLKSPTCLRLENGEFYAFEGTAAHAGSCEGTCDHVWGYQYAVPFLFPKFARQMLEIDYTYNMKESGEMLFRTMLPLGSEKWNFRACVDGQMGTVIRFYREWKLSGDDEWLKKWWGSVKKSLEYAWSPENRDRWDPEKSGVITGRQHHTLDMELFGPSAWLNGYYLAALKAAAEMAEHLGETETAAEYREIARKGQEYTDKELFNGRHYIQKVDLWNKDQLKVYAEYDPEVYVYWNDEKNELKYQIASGCGIDQMVGQWHSTLMGLGDIYDPEHRKIAAKTLYDMNFRSMREVFNPCRIFAANDERGVEMCVWAEDEYKPIIPVPYTEECMTGFEYAAAGLMIQQGMLEEGLNIIEAIRERYDGKKRNPFAEIECGSSYSRSMASFALPATYSGYSYDMVKGEIGFDPVEADKAITVFWSVDGAWGTAEIAADAITLKVSDGALKLSAFGLPKTVKALKAVSADGQEVSFCVNDGKTVFDQKISVQDKLVLTI